MDQILTGRDINELRRRSRMSSGAKSLVLAGEHTITDFRRLP